MARYMKKRILGPTFEEMLHPEKIDANIRQRALKAMKTDPLDPINLFNINWKDTNNKICYFVMPKEMTGVDANIVVLYGKDFPTESHKVGAAYSLLMEKVIREEVDPFNNTLIWPSTGNYGIGGAWVGSRMGFDSIVLMPKMMSQERFDLIEKYGGKIIRTPGCESNVKEIYDKSKELKKENPEKIRVLNQFEEFGNYRFHYYVTGNTMLELIEELYSKGIGTGNVSAVISAMGSAGTIACGDRVKEVQPRCKIVGTEPIQCPALTNSGYGGHDIQGIGDKHVTWIHNVMNMDAIVAIDDMESKKGLQLLTDPVGMDYISSLGVSHDDVQMMSQIFGISGVCNLYSAIKVAKYYDMTEKDTLFTIATDNIGRYKSVMKELDNTYGKIDACESRVRHEMFFKGVKTDWLLEATYALQKRWHNLKHSTWVEQQQKTVEELDCLMREEFWQEQRDKVKESDQLLEAYRKSEE